jgi:hypothetical protein
VCLEVFSKIGHSFIEVAEIQRLHQQVAKSRSQLQQKIIEFLS